MKRRVTADINDFFTFPSGDSPVDGPFRSIMKSFVSKYALLPTPSSLLPQLMTRQIGFRVVARLSRTRTVMIKPLFVLTWLRKTWRDLDPCIAISAESLEGQFYGCLKKVWVGILPSACHYKGLSLGRKPRTKLQDLVSLYQSISEDELVNIRDLFCFLMNLIRAAHKSPVRVDEDTFKKRKLCDSRILSAWTNNDIVRVEEAMFKVLRAITGSNWVSWRALRGAVCKAGPPELLDYCLKELKGKHAANGMVVNSRCIPESDALEYRLEQGSAPMTGGSTCQYSSGRNHPAESNLLHDLRYLYEAMLHPLTMLSFVPEIKWTLSLESAKKLLDCKQFVKNYLPENFLTAMHPSAVQLSCEVDLMDQSEDDAIKPPPEVIILPCSATISDIKIEGSRAFQEVYLSLRRFQAEEIIGYGGVLESTQVKLLFGSSETVRIRGKCLGKNGLTKFRMERGVESWIVDCVCGARDDDGERMLACDICGVWQHTRCSRIPDFDAVPARYVCRVCSASSGRVTKAKGDTVNPAYGSANGKIRVNWTTKA